MGKHSGSPSGGGSHKNDTSTEDLIKKVCEKFSSDISRKLDVLHADIASLKSSLDSIGVKVDANSSQIHVLDDKCDALEQLLKKNSLRVNGVPEAQNESVFQIIMDVLDQKLHIACNQSDIDYAFRIGQFKGITNTTPRPIIVKFINSAKKSEILAAKKTLKGSPITIFEDLTKQRFELLKECKKKYGNQAWAVGGKVFVWSPTQNKKIEIKSRADL